MPNTQDNSFFNIHLLDNEKLIDLILVEEIYKNNLDELADIVDGDVEAAVKNVRLKADKALENIQVHNKNTAVVGKDINK